MEKDKVNTTARQIRKELAILIQSKIKEGIPQNIAVDTARQETNKKYGKGWRDWATQPTSGFYDEENNWDQHWKD